MTSGSLGTMGYGLPAAMGVQVAHPDALVIDVAGESSIMMNIQEMSTLSQHRLPVKVFILNNQYMGMVRQWQEFFHGGRYAESYMDSLPDFQRLAESFGAVGLQATKPDEVDDVIAEMLATDNAAIADIRVDPEENVYPMIAAGAALALKHRSPAEFTTPNDERIVQHTALLQVGDQRPRWLVGQAAASIHVLDKAAVVVPASMVKMDEPHIAFGQTAGKKTVRRV